jgi:hypothetical protein
VHPLLPGRHQARQSRRLSSSSSPTSPPATSTPKGLATPAFVGKLVSYATSWGGLNIAGLDAGGNIWSVWWSPGLAKWTVSNLTEITGASKLTGSDSPSISPRGAGSTSPASTPTATFRSPGGSLRSVDEWQQSDLSADTTGGTATKFRASTRQQLCLLLGTGSTSPGSTISPASSRVFWWAPARVNDGWAITSLSAAVPAGSPVDHAGYHRICRPRQLAQCLRLHSATSQFIRYYWLPGGNWSTTNLTTTATAVAHAIDATRRIRTRPR